jgi:hypothetical protein
MVIKNTANLQSKIIAEMIELCRFQNYSIYKAARRVSGNDRFYNARADCQSLVKVSYKTVIRWYLHWFDFGMLPCQMKHKKGLNYNGTWTLQADSKLKEIIQNNPVLYLDEIANSYYFNEFIRQKFLSIEYI